MKQTTRQAATFKALSRRVRDARVDVMLDKRGRRGRRYKHFSIFMHALIFGLATGMRSLRGVESLTASLARKVRRASGILTRISDTKLRDALALLTIEDARAMLHRQVKAEHRRGNLEPTRLPIRLLSIDGKGITKLSSWGHKFIQKVAPKDGLPYGLARVHRAVLVSSTAAICLDTKPILGSTNEVGTICETLEELHEVYGRTSLFEAVIADAGNTSLKCATWLNEKAYGYILAIKGNHGELYREAKRLLDNALPLVTRRDPGKKHYVTYRLYRVRLEVGYLGWTHARQLIRVERIVRETDGTTTIGNRYFVSNLPFNRLNHRQMLKAVRSYWRIENCSNWTADVFWKEDTKRTPWTKNPETVYVMATLRMLAQNIVAVMRSLSRAPWIQGGKPTWDIVLRHLFAAITSEQHALA